MLQVINEDIWKYHEQGKPIAITTNGFVKKNGECVMGRGIAFQAKTKYPKLPFELGDRLNNYGNTVFYFKPYNLITFPVKHVWWEAADLELIAKSAQALQLMFKHNLASIPTPVYLTKVGCGNGKLNWEQVEPVLNRYLDDKMFIICDKEGLTA